MPGMDLQLLILKGGLESPEDSDGYQNLPMKDAARVANLIGVFPQGVIVYKPKTLADVDRAS
ncbi:hypothetical protein N7447_007057 [Penicillium robsamsonii]|uniref:uncharacterized protein n=1 Tax=Penicillium robsamsonii TaxID=1792511 RepID=UPI002548821C|nr:uncharacterized protein N7447_007057 [Penicillium robsamsonii]KAJ5824717.1 hypothetical protein N7447_007057 [Penicillium robsamsonii]